MRAQLQNYQKLGMPSTSKESRKHYKRKTTSDDETQEDIKSKKVRKSSTLTLSNQRLSSSCSAIQGAPTLKVSYLYILYASEIHNVNV